MPPQKLPRLTDSNLVPFTYEIAKQVNQVLDQLRNPPLIDHWQFFNPIYRKKAKEAFTQMRETEENIQRIMKDLNLLSSNELKKLDTKTMNIKNVLNVILVDYLDLLDKRHKISDLWDLAHDWVEKRQIARKYQKRELGNLKEEIKAKEQDEDKPLWDLQEFKHELENAEYQTEAGSLTEVLDGEDLYKLGRNNLWELQGCYYSCLPGLIEWKFKSRELSETGLDIQVILVFFHLALKAKDLNVVDNSVTLLQWMESIKTVLVKDDRILSHASEFIKELLSSNIIVKNILKVHQMFNFGEIISFSDETDGTKALEELRKELMELIPAEIVIFPKCNIAAYAFADGSIGIVEDYLEKLWKDDDSVEISKAVILIFHELVHKKRLKNNPEWEEVGEKIFGVILAGRTFDISEEISRKILDVKTWESLDSLKGIYQVVSHLLEERTTNSRFCSYWCLKEAWNQIILRDSQEDSEELKKLVRESNEEFWA